MRRGIWKVMGLLVMTGGMSAGAWAQAPSDSVSEQRADDASRHGIRFTPRMARGMARVYVDEFLRKRYELEEGRTEEATDVVAHRLMELAHKLDKEDYNRAVEEMVTQLVKAELEADATGDRPGIKPRSGKALADGVLPAMPAVRDLFQGVARDVRPMLAPKQQLKLAGDLMALSTATDVFEKTMERWSQGQVRPFENPFSGDEQDIKKDEQGRSQAHNNAVRNAENEIENGQWTHWAKYVEEAKKFYQLDDSQSASADSILRECLERVDVIRARNHWREQVYRNRLWKNMAWQLQIGQGHPLWHCLERSYDEVMNPIASIENDLKERIDEIPTQAQRQAAEGHMLDLLTEQGFAEQPAATAEQRNAAIPGDGPGLESDEKSSPGTTASPDGDTTENR